MKKNIKKSLLAVTMMTSLAGQIISTDIVNGAQLRNVIKDEFYLCNTSDGFLLSGKYSVMSYATENYKYDGDKVVYTSRSLQTEYRKITDLIDCYPYTELNWHSKSKSGERTRFTYKKKDYICPGDVDSCSNYESTDNAKYNKKNSYNSYWRVGIYSDNTTGLPIDSVINGMSLNRATKGGK